MAAHPDVPTDIVLRLSSICLGLPEAHEERAWVGTRWMIGKKHFAHVLTVAAGWPPAYAQAAATQGPATLLTFRLPLPRAEAPRFKRRPFFRPVWFPNIVGMSLGGATDWDEVADLLTESYCVLAPKKLAALVDRLAN